jgi:hypothetical protein
LLLEVVIVAPYRGIEMDGQGEERDVVGNDCSNRLRCLRNVFGELAPWNDVYDFEQDGHQQLQVGFVEASLLLNDLEMLG